MQSPTLPRLATCALIAASICFAQLDLGSIDGTVTDSSGAVVRGAKVVVKDLERNNALSLATNESGLYSAPLLRPGQYEVTVEAPGFRREIRRGIIVQVQDKLKIDFAMQLGQLNESVEVTA